MSSVVLRGDGHLPPREVKSVGGIPPPLQKQAYEPPRHVRAYDLPKDAYPRVQRTRLHRCTSPTVQLPQALDEDRPAVRSTSCICPSLTVMKSGHHVMLQVVVQVNPIILYGGQPKRPILRVGTPLDSKGGDEEASLILRERRAISEPKNSTSTILSQKLPPVPGKYINIPMYEKHLHQNLDINGGSWVDSMRASSPTHVKSTTSLTPSALSLEMPSALDMFKHIINSSKGKQIVMFLDYDGTLSPIVDDPDRAFMSDAMRDTVRRLAKHFPTAIVSGRSLDKVYNFVQLPKLYYAGSHGMDIKSPANKCFKFPKKSQEVVFQPASEFIPMIEQVYKTLSEKTKNILGASVEHNKFCLSVHYRLVDENKWNELAQEVRSVLEEYPELQLAQGRKVFEIRPAIKWDKGKALEFILESLGLANRKDVFPVYIGDDRTDEDAFKVLRYREQGCGILVSKIAKETNASYYLQEPPEVMSFLQRLVKWRRESLKRWF
ncbi:probable trehalose-phosphate phosphatase H [Spinacia oleracea]|uniref:Trehalose 6-phosphate phosphatase n=1 Tax=Spinacia oleracea TaxID=3562 RepID=A0ABM3RJ48_SPIOL|nr:probable trehalose-phosphate phosphatase H [Spinacia oleracea]